MSILYLVLNHFSERAIQSKHLSKQTITKKEFIELLKNKIHKTDIDLAKADVVNFVKNKKMLNIWSTNYFLQIADLMKFV